MENVRVLLKAVEESVREHVVKELAKHFSIDEETSRSILGHAPIVLLDGLAFDVAVEVRKKLKKLIALGAKIVLTDDEEAVEEYPRVTWPEGELPEIVQEALETLEEKNQKDSLSQGVETHPVPGTFVCPCCGEAFSLTPLGKSHPPSSPNEEGGEEQRGQVDELEGVSSGNSDDLAQEEKSDVSEAPPLPLQKPSSPSSGATLQVSIQESSLEIATVELDNPILDAPLLEEELPPMEVDGEGESSSESSGEAVSVEEQNLSEESSSVEEFAPLEIGEESALELEPEEPIISFDSQLIEEPKVEELIQSAQEGSRSEDSAIDLDATIDFQALPDDDSALEEMPPPLINPEATLNLEAVPDNEVEGIQSFDLDAEEAKETTKLPHQASFQSSPEATINLEAVDDGVEGVQTFDPLAEEKAPLLSPEEEKKLLEPSEVDLEAFAPPELEEEEVSATDLSVLDSDEMFQAVEEIPSEELALDNILQPSEELLHMFQKAKEEKSSQQEGPELEPLSPEEALAFFQNPSSLLGEEKGSRSEGSREKSPKFQKLKTTRRAAVRGGKKVQEGTGPHSVVLAKVPSSDKREQAAKVVADIRNISLSEARKLLERAGAALVRGVDRQVASEVSHRLKKAGLSVRVTTRGS